MTPERWRRVEELFQLALQQAPEERAAFVARTAPDTALGDEVLQLIAADAKSGAFLHAPAPAQVGAGKAIGPYRVLGEIGRGGMGAVYRAVRDDDQYQKQVAIKLVSGPGWQLALERFRAERQILANLEHPNIARLLDGGTTPEGWPWFAMEFVDGDRLDKYCESRALSTAQRLELFLQVCAAVQYAHQRLVIHRDLKPGNILVTAEGVPKLLDFGIAKLLGPDAAPGNTATGAMLMTPDYGSPEQVKGEPVTTASDVYSLGMVLYELLARAPAYRIETGSAAEIARVVCQFEPQPPSAVAPREVARQLAGDLDTIVLKALRKEAGRRYASVQDLAEDLRRHLQGLPVTARRDTPAYRAGKFARRHKTAVIGAALLLASLLGGLFATARQARIARENGARAQRRFDEVRKLAHNVIFKYHDGIAQLPGSTAVRAMMVSDALEYLDNLARESESDVSLLGELAEAYTKVSEVQGGTNTGSIGDSAAQLASLQKAVAIREKIAALRPGDARARADLAEAYLNLTQPMKKAGNPAGALEVSRKSFAVLQKLAEAQPGDLAVRNQLAKALFNVADASGRVGDSSSAIEDFRKAGEIYQGLAAAEPANPKHLRNAALQYKYLSGIFFDRGEKKESLVFARKALAIDEQRLAANPLDTGARLDAAFSASAVGLALLKGDDGAGALELFHKSLKLRLTVLEADPKNTLAARSAASAYGHVAYALVMLGRFPEAVDAGREQTSRLEAVVAADPADRQTRELTAVSYGQLGEIWMKRAAKGEPGAWAEARSWLLRAAKAWEALKQQGPLTSIEADKAALIAPQIAECDAALARAK